MIGRGGGGAVDNSSLVHAGAHLAIFGVFKLARLSDRGERLRLEDVVGDLAGGQRLGLDVLALGVVIGLPLPQRLADARVPAQVVEEGFVEVLRLGLLRAGFDDALCALARAWLAVLERTRALSFLELTGLDLWAARLSLKLLSGGPLATSRHVCRHLVCLPAIRSMATHVGSRRTGAVGLSWYMRPQAALHWNFFCTLAAD